MKLAKYKACICEGSAESAIIDILIVNIVFCSSTRVACQGKTFSTVTDTLF